MCVHRLPPSGLAPGAVCRVPSNRVRPVRTPEAYPAPYGPGEPPPVRVIPQE
ncbi:hypothetical protein STENM223S_02380 [Streptomyces tendae]